MLLMIPVLLGTAFVNYAAVHALPGDPVQALAGPGHVVTPSVNGSPSVRGRLGPEGRGSAVVRRDPVTFLR